MKIFTTLKSLSLATGLSVLPIITSAAPVTFWLSGKVNAIYNPSNAMPADIKLGTPVAGRWMFDSATASYVAGITEPSGSVSNFYCRPVSGYATLLQIGSHVITNTSILPGWAGYVNIYDNYNNCDELYLHAGPAGLMQDGTLLTNSALRIALRDNTKTALNSAQFPTNPPVLTAYADQRILSWEVRNLSNSLLYRVEAELTAISTNELVLLNIRTGSANTAAVCWPSGVQGLQLQSTTNLAAPVWQDVATPVVDIGMEHTVTVSTTGAPKFYRLKK